MLECPGCGNSDCTCECTTCNLPLWVCECDLNLPKDDGDDLTVCTECDTIFINCKCNDMPGDTHQIDWCETCEEYEDNCSC